MKKKKHDEKNIVEGRKGDMEERGGERKKRYRKKKTGKNNWNN